VYIKFEEEFDQLQVRISQKAVLLHDKIFQLSCTQI